MAFNLFNRFYYGKAGKADYTRERLPATRLQLFFEMLRVRFWGLMGVNALYLIFCAPMLIWTGFSYLMSTTAESLMDSGILTGYLIGLIPCLGLAGVGATGEMFVLRNWARDQHSFVVSDFKDAIKGNWKCGLAMGLMSGAILFLTYLCVMYYGELAEQSFVWMVPRMITIVVCVIWWMMNMLAYTMMVTYDMKLKTILRNCALIAIGRLPWSALFLGVTVAFPVILVTIPYGLLILALFYLLIGFALTGFVYASYANSCFDKYLNPRIEGAKVGMGLRPKDADDDLEDVDDPNPLI